LNSQISTKLRCDGLNIAKNNSGEKQERARTMSKKKPESTSTRECCFLGAGFGMMAGLFCEVFFFWGGGLVVGKVYLSDFMWVC